MTPASLLLLNAALEAAQARGEAEAVAKIKAQIEAAKKTIEKEEYKKTRRVEDDDGDDEEAPPKKDDEDEDAEDEESDEEADDEDSEDEDASEEDSEDEESDEDASEDSEDEKPEEKKSKYKRAMSSAAGREHAATLLTTISDLLGTTDAGEIVGKLNALINTTASAVKLAERVQKLERSARKQRVVKMVERGVRAGKLTPAQREWAIALGTSNLKSLSAYLDTAPALVAPSEPKSREKAPEAAQYTSSKPGTAESVMSKFGITPEQFAAQAAKDGPKFPVS